LEGNKKGGKRMETTLAILMALGIYVGIPVVIGLAIGGVFVMADRRVRRTQKAAVNEAKAAIEKPEKEHALVG
jgi:flagellar biosynthesis component FlhA